MKDFPTTKSERSMLVCAKFKVYKAQGVYCYCLDARRPGRLEALALEEPVQNSTLKAESTKMQLADRS